MICPVRNVQDKHYDKITKRLVNIVLCLSRVQGKVFTWNDIANK